MRVKDIIDITDRGLRIFIYDEFTDNFKRYGELNNNEKEYINDKEVTMISIYDSNGLSIYCKNDSKKLTQEFYERYNNNGELQNE